MVAGKGKVVGCLARFSPHEIDARHHFAPPYAATTVVVVEVDVVFVEVDVVFVVRERRSNIPR